MTGLLLPATISPAAAQEAGETSPGESSPRGMSGGDGREVSRAAARGPREAAARELARRLDRLLDDPALRRAHVGMRVQLAETGEVLYDRAAEKRFIPASTVKLVTAAVALRRLGPGFRWTTSLGTEAPVRDGLLDGDLWIVGSGDPTLTVRDLASWASELRARGVRRIAGDVIADDRAYPPPRWGRGWMWDELHLGWAAGVGGLQLDSTELRGVLLPGPAPGTPALFRLVDPDLRSPVAVRVRTGATGSESRLVFLPPAAGIGGAEGPGGAFRRGGAAGPGIAEGAESARGRIEGWIPADADSVHLSLAPVHPTLHLLERLGRILSDSGIAVEGRLRRIREEEATGAWRCPACGPGREGQGGEPPTGDPEGNAGATTLAVTVSDSLGAVLPRLLAPSDNQAAESLLRTLGAREGRAGTAAEGLEVVADELSSLGIDPDALHLVDGSGLSRYDLITPAALVRLLRALWRGPHRDLLADALAGPDRPGTLAGRLLDTHARDGLRAKTGSLSSVRGLAGYVADGDGETLVFALLLNGYDVPGATAEGLRDLVVEQLALFHRAVEPGWPGLRCEPTAAGGGR